MSDKEFENSYTKMWKEIASWPPEIQEIYFIYWDDTGRPNFENSADRAMLAILNKNIKKDFSSFKLDMDIIFNNKVFSDSFCNIFSEKQLYIYYNVYNAHKNSPS